MKGESWTLILPWNHPQTTVYIYPFKTNDVKMKTIFSLIVTIKVTFPWKKKNMLKYDNCFELNYAPPFSYDYDYHHPPYGLTLPIWRKKNSSPNDLSFSKLKWLSSLMGGGHHVRLKEFLTMEMNLIGQKGNEWNAFCLEHWKD